MNRLAALTVCLLSVMTLGSAPAHAARMED
jgi:hypothetical protein